MSSQRKTIQELSENGHLHAIPSDFIVPEEERCNLKDKLRFSTTEAALELPLIDMDEVAETQLAAGGDCHSELVQQIRTACEEWGFFQVKNHGVSSSLMKRMQQVVHEFLELPSEQKNKMRFASLDGRANLAGGYTSNYTMSEGGISNWSDRLSLRMFPTSIRKYDLWPKNPPCFR
jgi:hypothetical protein